MFLYINFTWYLILNLFPFGHLAKFIDKWHLRNLHPYMRETLIDSFFFFYQNILPKYWPFQLQISFGSWIFIRPRVAGTVLQTPVWFIESVNEWVILCDHIYQNTFTPKPEKTREFKYDKRFTSHNQSCVMCHISHVTYHVSHITYYMTIIIIFLK